MSSAAELPGPCPVGEVAHPSGDAPERDLLRPVDDRDDQALVVEVDGDPEVDLLVHDQRVLGHRRVQVRVLPERLHRGPGHEREVRQREALFGLEPFALASPYPLDVLEVDFVGDEGVRRRRLRPHHVLRRPAAHVRERDHPVRRTDDRRRGIGRRLRSRWLDSWRRRRRGRGWWRGRLGRCGRHGGSRRRGRSRSRGWLGCGSRCRGRGGASRTGVDDGQHVLPGDPAADAGAGHLRGVDAVVRQQTPDHRRQHALVTPGRDGLRSGGRRLGGQCRLGRRHGGRDRRGWRTAGAGAGQGRQAGPRAAVGRARREAGLVQLRAPGQLPGRGRALPGRPPRPGQPGRLQRPSPITARRAPTSTVSPSWDEDLGQDAGGRGGDLGVDLVGRHLEERLVPGDLVADLLHPPGDRALGDGLAELRHGDVSQRGVPFRSTPAPSRRRSRTATGGAG